MTIDAPVTIRVEQVELLSVTGQLDDPGLDQLQYRLDKLLDGGHSAARGGPARSGRL